MAVTIPSFLRAAGDPDVIYNHKEKIVKYLSITDMVLPYDFIGLTAVIYNNQIHVIGGNNASSGNVTYHIKWNGTEWVTASTVPIAFVDGRAAVLGDELHLISGDYHYLFNGTSWSEQTLPSGVSAAGSSIVVYNDQLHILGGTSNKTIHYKYNGTRWVSVSTLPRNLVKGVAIVYNGDLHIIGGGFNTQFKWDGTAWEQLANNCPTYTNGSAVVLNDYIYFLGSSGSYFNGTSWTTTSNVLFSPTYNAAVVYNGMIFYMGNAANVRRFCMKFGDSILSSYSIS